MEQLSEHGNTLLVNNDQMVAWLTIDGDSRLEVSWHPGNNPALKVVPLVTTDEELVQFINSKMQGWFVQESPLDGLEIDNTRDQWYDSIDDDHTVGHPHSVDCTCPECINEE